MNVTPLKLTAVQQMYVEKLCLAGKAQLSIITTDGSGEYMIKEPQNINKFKNVRYVSRIIRKDDGSIQYYQYIGFIYIPMKYKGKPGFKPKDTQLKNPKMLVFKHFWENLVWCSLPETTRIRFSNNCCRCGRPLKDSVQRKNRIGPTCAKKLKDVYKFKYLVDLKKMKKQLSNVDSRFVATK